MQTRPGILSADYKVEGGKLLRVQMTVDAATDGAPVIHSLTITGDFFMHPEEAIEALERQLGDARLEEDELRARIQAFFAGDVEVVGAGVEDFVRVLLKAA